MLWEYRKKALKRIPKWFIKVRIRLLMLKLQKSQVFDKEGNIRGRIIDMVIRDYLRCLLFKDRELSELYEKIKKEKERLLKENEKLLYEVMRRMRVKGEDWEEVYSCALEGLFHAVENWDGKHALSTIAYTYIMSKIQDYYEKKGKSFAFSYSKEINDEGDTFEIFLKGEDSQEAVDLEIALSRLLPDEEQAVKLVYWHGYSTKEAGRLLGLSMTKVQTLLKRALSKLKYYLNPSGRELLGSQREVYA